MDYNIRLTKEELENLLLFLGRATMTGNEAMHFTHLVAKLQQAEIVKEEVKK